MHYLLYSKIHNDYAIRSEPPDKATRGWCSTIEEIYYNLVSMKSLKLRFTSIEDYIYNNPEDIIVVYSWEKLPTFKELQSNYPELFI